jgi:hypothetical protein
VSQAGGPKNRGVGQCLMCSAKGGRSLASRGSFALSQRVAKEFHGLTVESPGPKVALSLLLGARSQLFAWMVALGLGLSVLVPPVALFARVPSHRPFGLLQLLPRPTIAVASIGWRC